MLTYNREQFIGRAIESVRAQTFRDFELILVDNGSADKSGTIADEYAKRDLRIRAIHRARGNIGAGRNTGLDAARGEYIAFVDDDDCCESDFLEFLHDLATDTEADVSICGTQDRSSVERRIMTAEESILTLMRRKHYSNGFPAKLFNRKLFDALRFSEQGKYDDIGLMYRVLAKASKIVFHGLPKYNVRRHGGNNSAPTVDDGRITAEYIAFYRAAYCERTNRLCERFPGNAEYWRYFNYSFMISMIHKVISNRIPDCELLLNEMKDELSANHERLVNCEHIQDFERERLAKYVEVGK
jgi:glycosyltransferase involved in cell wall biosynthesis